MWSYGVMSLCRSIVTLLHRYVAICHVVKSQGSTYYNRRHLPTTYQDPRNSYRRIYSSKQTGRVYRIGEQGRRGYTGTRLLFCLQACVFVYARVVFFCVPYFFSYLQGCDCVRKLVLF